MYEINFLSFEAIQKFNIFAHPFLVDLIFGVAAIFFGDKQIGIKQLLQVMGNRGLGKLKHFGNG